MKGKQKLFSKEESISNTISSQTLIDFYEYAFYTLDEKAKNNPWYLYSLGLASGPISYENFETYKNLTLHEIHDEFGLKGKEASFSSDELELTLTRIARLESDARQGFSGPDDSPIPLHENFLEKLTDITLTRLASDEFDYDLDLSKTDQKIYYALLGLNTTGKFADFIQKGVMKIFKEL